MTSQNDDFATFFLRLPVAERERLASRAGTTETYVRSHLLAGRRLPRRKLLRDLVEAAAEFGGKFTEQELMACFLVQERAA